jgi:hypothetical protein
MSETGKRHSLADYRAGEGNANAILLKMVPRIDFIVSRIPPAREIKVFS